MIPNPILIPMYTYLAPSVLDKIINSDNPILDLTKYASADQIEAALIRCLVFLNVYNIHTQGTHNLKHLDNIFTFIHQELSSINSKIVDGCKESFWTLPDTVAVVISNLNIKGY